MMLFGDYHSVTRLNWMNVQKSQIFVVFPNFISGNCSGNDFAEKAVFHWIQYSSNWKFFNEYLKDYLLWVNFLMLSKSNCSFSSCSRIVSKVAVSLISSFSSSASSA